jgi:two-component system response regulator DevR
VSDEQVRPPRLTAREQEILKLVAAGLSNKEIGVRIFRSERTAKFHVSSLLRKFGVKKRQQLICAACKMEKND